MSRIAATFAALARRGRKALIPYVTAGDPHADTTPQIMRAMVEAGADVIELGVPFSDPMADGPVIQKASERALARRIGLDDVLAMVRDFRVRDRETPVVLMGYANPIERYGVERFVADAQAAGVDGVLVVDYPPQEAAPFAELLAQRKIDAIFLLSPTSTETRIKEVARYARGYVYYVSLRGVTGAANLDVSDVAKKLPEIRAHIKLPIGVGFGIRDAKTARAVADVADAVVIGSRLVQEIESSPRERVLDNIANLVKDIRSALDH